MELLFLTKTGGILGPFATVLGWIINYIYKFLELLGITRDLVSGDYFIYAGCQYHPSANDDQAAEILKAVCCNES